MQRIANLFALFSVTVACFSARSEDADKLLDSPDYWKPAQQAVGKLGDGFVLWETHRTGHWSIWRVNLDGTGTRQISAEEDRDHAGVKISPDGKRAVYLSFPKQPPAEDGCPSPMGQTVPLHIVNVDGTGDRVLIADARSYSGWQRCATWFNNDEIAYIAGDGNTYQFTISTGVSTLLISRPTADSPSWLPNSTKTYAVWSFNTFSPFDPKIQRVKPLPHMGGCQPYFTQDGEWGFWESYCGGPVGTVHLSSWVVAGDRTLFTPTLSRAMMPSKHRDYIYFPMYSSDRRLLTFAARDHEAPGGYGKADWDIFVVQTDPSNLEVIGKPIRYTFDPECDRFPDVWQTPLPLGFHSEKAPFTADFTSPANGNDTWDFGDGATAAGAKVSHTYDKPGLYTVSAAQGKEVRYGQVQIREALPPCARRVILKDARELAVVFNEPVELKNIALSLKSQTKIEKTVAGKDGRTLQIYLAQQPNSNDALLIDGVTDLSQHPNKMPASEVPFDVRIWPSTRDGLVFLWQGSNKPNVLHDSEKGDLSCGIVARGRAWYNHDRDMIVDGGAFAIQGLSEVFSKAIQKSKSFTIELSLSKGEDDGRHTILSYGLDVRGNKFILRNGSKEIEEQINGGYLAITYKDGHLTTYRGINMSLNTGLGNQFLVQPATDTDALPIDLKSFAAEPLLIGSNAQGDGWGENHGHELGLTVRSIALYDRALNADELSANFRGRCAIELDRPKLDPIRMSGYVVAQSDLPQPKQIAPYTRALSVNEYDVADSADGKTRKRIRVAHWVLFDKQFSRIAQLAPKADLNFVSLEPFAANKQFEGEYISDTLDPNPDIPLYFCPQEHRVTRGGTLQVELMGTFTVPESGGLDAATEFEKTLTNPNKTYVPVADQKWKTFRIPYVSDGYFDLNAQYPDAKGNCAYAHFYVKMPQARKAIVAAESFGGEKVWLNGQPVLSIPANHATQRGQKHEAVQLNAGWNEFVVKAIKTGKMWGFVCDILDANGREMPDIQFTTDLDKPAFGTQ